MEKIPTEPSNRRIEPYFGTGEPKKFGRNMLVTIGAILTAIGILGPILFRAEHQPKNK